VPAVELLDDTMPLTAIDVRVARRLDEALLRASDEQGAFDALNRELTGWLERRQPDPRQPDPLVGEAVALLARRAATVAEVAQRVFLSERQLERRFADHVGYGPKTLQRILRLQHVVRQLESHGAAGRLAEVAASAGYADQSRLSRETRRLTGLTPRQLVRWIG
jgi:AraC-like DNA-binding protein